MSHMSFQIEEIETAASYKNGKSKGLSGLGVLVGSEQKSIVASFAPGLPSPADTSNSAWFNAFTYVIGPDWSKMPTNSRLSALRDAKAAKKPYMTMYPTLVRVKEIQKKLNLSQDGKFGSITGAVLAKKVPDYRKMSYDSIIKALSPMKILGGPSVEKEVVTTKDDFMPEAATVAQKANAIATEEKKAEAKEKAASLFSTRNILIAAGVGVLGLAFFMMRK